MATHTQRDTESFLGTTRLWTPEELALLGKLTDEEVARRTRRTVATVERTRIELGRPKLNATFRKWTRQEEALLKRFPDRVVAERQSVRRYNVVVRRHVEQIPRFDPRRPFTPEEDALLGTLPVAELVIRLHRPLSAVYKRHAVLGIPARPRSRWTPAADALLGTAYDHEVGAKLGLSYAAVRKRRVKLGVPAHVPKPKTRRPR